MTDSSMFTRTIEGKIAEYLFYQRPLVWVEGPTDCTVFQPLARALGFVLQSSDGGKKECQKLAEAMILEDRPYVVVMDGDYDILVRTRSRHRRVVLPMRHSIENYFVEPELIANICAMFTARSGQRVGVRARFLEDLEHFENAVRELLLLDVAVQISACDVKILPSDIGQLSKRGNAAIVDENRVKTVMEEKTAATSGKLSESSRSRAALLVENFVRTKRLADLLKGHLVFSWLRWFVCVELDDAGVRLPLMNEGFRALLATQMWSETRGSDHASLRRRLGRAVREVRVIRNARAKEEGA